MSSANKKEVGLAPYLAVKDGNKAVEFYTKIFGAKEVFRLSNPEGRLAHAEIEFKDGSLLMLAEEFPGYSQAPETVGGTPVRICVAVDDVDDTIKRAEQAGAKVLHPPSDQFYGYRSGTIRDPFGHEWLVQRQIEEVEIEEMQRRFDEMCQAMSTDSHT